MQKRILHVAALTKKKEAMQGGQPLEVVRVFGRAGDVWLVAQEASAEVTVASGRGSREEEENGRSCREERERFTVALDGW
jgi:hypothetical protein